MKQYNLTDLSAGDKIFVTDVMGRYVSISNSIIQISTGSIALIFAFSENFKIFLEFKNNFDTIFSIGIICFFFSIVLAILYMIISTYMILYIFVIPNSEIYQSRIKLKIQDKLKQFDKLWHQVNNLLFLFMVITFLVGVFCIVFLLLNSVHY